MRRVIDQSLLDWKNDRHRKVLIVRGARQVGKTYSIRRLGEKFDYFLEINFEKDAEVAEVFKGSLSPKPICEKLSAYFKVPIIPNKTLIFFDEIQTCLNATRALRFFYEDYPEIHVVAAGSLLEFVLEEIPSHGVGRLSNLFMYPLSFQEFLLGLNEDALLEIVNTGTSNKQVDLIFHQRAIEYLRIFLIIGGMPEVVANYVENHDILQCQKTLDEIIITAREDFAKYKKRSPVIRLREVFDSITYQTGKKFKYSNIDPSVKSLFYKDSLDLLVQAGLAYKVHHTSAWGIPFGAQINSRKFKVVLFDIGIHQRIQQNDISSIIVSSDFNVINKGNLVEAFVGLELIKNNAPHIPSFLYYWHRETASSNAEVDYVIQRGEQILPIEVKAGTKGQMQSMNLFLKERNLSTGVRISFENFASYKNIEVLPLYAINRLLGLNKVRPR